MGTFDLLVIGGGATGAGVALDAATRGTKLIHGGVRYLEGAIKHLDCKEFHLVTDALHEMALTAIDAIARRLRLAFLDSEAANKALPRVIELMAEVHGWDANRCKQEEVDAHSFLETMSCP